MPKLGLTMTEGLLADWSVQPGKPYKAGDTIVLIETEKVVTEIAAEADGVLLEIVVPVGETVPVGAIIGRWGNLGEEVSAPLSAASVDGNRTVQVPAEIKTSVQPREPSASPGSLTKLGERVVATPLARRLAAQHSIDLTKVTGNGPRGRIRASDVELSIQEITITPATMQQPEHVSGEKTQRRPASAFQKVAAKRLVEVKREVPHFYLSSEAEVSELISLRARLNALSGEGQPRLTFNHFILAAVGRSLADMPAMNALWDDGSIIQLASPDVGMAINVERGVVAPVIRNAGASTLAAIARQADVLVGKAKENRLKETDYSDCAITVSNAGMYSVTYMSSIIGPGQSSILGVGSIRQVFRPDQEGRPALKNELGLVLSVDHRLFDGVFALQFLNRVIGYLQEPLRLLNGI